MIGQDTIANNDLIGFGDAPAAVNALPQKRRTARPLPQLA